MDERVIQFRVGVVMFAAATITGILIVLFGALPTLERQYTLHIQFPGAPGVAVNTPVRKSGVPIGRVSKVKLLDEGGVLLSMRINQTTKLRRNEICRISNGSLVTGDAIVEWIAAKNPDVPDEVLTDGEFLTNGEIQPDPFQVLVDLESRIGTTFTSIQEAATSIETASDEAAVLMRRFQNTVGNNDDQVKRILTKTESSLDSFQATMTSFRDAMTSVQELFGDPRVSQEPKPRISVPELFEETQQTLREAREAIGEFKKIGGQFQTNLANLEKFTEPLGREGPQLIGQLDTTLRNVDGVLLELREFSVSLNEGEGTIGMLVRDRGLYDRLNNAVSSLDRTLNGVDSALENVDQVTRQLRPIVSDVRIFTDKIARDPRQLGVKGALDRRPSGAGLKMAPR